MDPPMMMLNVWRIPLLFFVSGMGIYMAIQNRNWKALVKERAVRILIPFLVGTVLIVPLHVYVWEYYYHFPLNYAPNPGHLWFLGNIFIYVLLFTPLFFYIKRNDDGMLVRKLKAILSHPLGLVIVVMSFVVEAIVIDPTPYELYAMTWHGFFLGMLAFFFGFCFMLSGEAFRKMLDSGRWFFLLPRQCFLCCVCMLCLALHLCMR